MAEEKEKLAIPGVWNEWENVTELSYWTILNFTVICVATQKSTNDTKHCSVLLETMNDVGLSQHTMDATRPASGKILDLMLTNRPSSVNEVQSLPGMSDHNIVSASFKLAVSTNKLPQRKIYKYDNAEWDEIREATNNMVNDYFNRDPLTGDLVILYD